jgi:hypothetical protein
MTSQAISCHSPHVTMSEDLVASFGLGEFSESVSPQTLFASCDH